MVRIEHRESEGPFAPEAGGEPPATYEAAAEAARELVSAGAIMTLPEPRFEQHLVGHLEWMDPRRLFWFTAYGETIQDGHLLDFDSLHVIEDRGIYFSRAGNIVSQLTPINQAKVEDPDDYRIAWQLWQEVAPLRRSLIERCCTALLRGLALDEIDGRWSPSSRNNTGAVPTPNLGRANMRRAAPRAWG